MKKLHLNEIAKRFNFNEATIRFYDEKDLMPFLKSETSGYRYLNEIDFPWVEIIVCFKKN